LIKFLISMKENIKTIKNVVMEFSFGHLAMNTEEIILMIYAMVTEKCIGQTLVIIKVCGSVAFNQEKENCLFPEKEFERESLLIIFSKAIIKMKFLRIMGMIQAKRKRKKKRTRMERMINRQKM
jgi:hypothetical protein